VAIQVENHSALDVSETRLMTGGEAVVQSLIRQGVDTIFALPGVQLDGLFSALYDARDRIRVIHTRHEQAAAYMADGYARVSGREGVCVVVPGPGVLNAAAYRKLAEAFDISARRAETPQELRLQLREAIKANEPTLIEVPVGPMPNLWKALGLR
jgi:thiamine pyrophosphate-dependent acetolactate synthase large subunit-like protein